ncbi:NADP-dependent oxidoreductase [Nocardia gipuzkoensis]|uniref:NADP-dependent oxidoreductase n=1 Tax=Nocardia gipuzkoensis TaxID=2749991 RepID=UPI00237E16E1|nr:NADP-dependent oxidoreductase [Nocardia gipuzkoensis]MDE1675370.1 NADP-dependent oxidoreductase [Nocardia gipuzkoensis]
MTKAVVFERYGAPDVLKTVDVDIENPGHGELMIAVAAAGVQPFDALFRRGDVRQFAPAQFPQQLGNEFAGTVVDCGQGVDGIEVGDHVLGWAEQRCYAQHLVVDATQVVAKPAEMPWQDAGVISASGQTASTALDILGVGPGETVLIHAAAGGVGSYAVQLAVARGANVIGTARPANHEYLSSLGATPVAYGAGLIERVRALAPDGVDSALIAVGTTEAFTASVELVPRSDHIATVAYSSAAMKYGIRVISTDRSQARLRALTEAYSSGALATEIQAVYDLDLAVAAHEAIETGHVRGKLALVVS